ncbi:MAG: DNA repair protein RecN [Gammaproteobacteria bacterium]|nr:DNA repair protein RecN [Gammaproteobacteria bacterium]
MNLQVRDFAIVEKIDIEFEPGMTVLTGETGAGKSILVDALGLVLGERGSAQLVRDGAKRAEFAAEFDVSNLQGAIAWLNEQALDLDGECLLRRVINADGRSRAFINGNPVPLTQLKILGEMLLDIHGQHFHQSLGRRAVQRDLLDHFGELLDQRAATATCYSEWTAVADRLSHLLDADANRASRLDLLTFQLQELETLAPGAGEIEELGRERQILQNSGRLAAGTSATLDALMDGDSGNAYGLISEAVRSLNALAQFDSTLEPLIEMLDSAAIQISESAETLRRYGNNIDMDPQRRDWVEERLDAFQAAARKHRTSPSELPALQQRLQQEFDELTNSAERGRELELQSAALRKQYLAKATALSVARSEAAKSFSAAVTDAMSSLGMPGGVFAATLARRDESSARPWGIDDIEFQISANPGQKPQPLAKIASGGELSRMSLAIQVIASDGSSIPTMVFDEVDSGVGGAVAEMVGRRLQEIGEHRQVLCVTHLPQVASLADQHFRISKVSDGRSTRTGLKVLGKDERIQELARMLGGVEITRKTLEHAEEMLAGARQKLAESNAG